uniref:Uncharacterized protein n=1 Tax=Caenorhabditis japonica TaxID=281687 RepID=A0A8R1DTS0_CAEJA
MLISSERVDKGDDVKRKRFNKSSCEDEQNSWEFRTEQFEEEDESMSINSAVHDFNRDSSGYEEYRPERVLLASIIKSNSNILHGDFESALERFRLELKSTVSDPLKVVIGGVQYSVCLQFYQSTLDMEASKKIHGLPIWKKYGSCARCDVKGRRVKLKKGYTISWYPDESVEQYSISNIPSAGLRSTCLPPPWADGYDALHLINEGTSRDLLRDLLGPGSRLKLSLSKQTRKVMGESVEHCANAKRNKFSYFVGPNPTICENWLRSATDVQCPHPHIDSLRARNNAASVHISFTLVMYTDYCR